MEYERTTGDITIRVRPEFMETDSEPEAWNFLWAYTIEIINGGPHAVQVLSRYWQITDGMGRIEEVRGKGVIGKQPNIEPGKSFSYTSGAPLRTPSGIMCGTYEIRDDNGKTYPIIIPTFSLDSPFAAARIN